MTDTPFPQAGSAAVHVLHEGYVRDDPAGDRVGSSVTLILDEGAAFTGDLRSPAMVADDAEDVTHISWEKIRSFGVKTIYPGHGPAGHID